MADDHNRLHKAATPGPVQMIGRSVNDNTGPPPVAFASIDSRDKAHALFRQGRLAKLLLLPEAWGGEDIPGNVVYVPFGIAAKKEQIDRDVIAPRVMASKVMRYSAIPSYAGESFIPTMIMVDLTGPDSYSICLRIWGDDAPDLP